MQFSFTVNCLLRYPSCHLLCPFQRYQLISKKRRHLKQWTQQNTVTQSFKQNIVSRRQRTAFTMRHQLKMSPLLEQLAREKKGLHNHLPRLLLCLYCQFLKDRKVKDFSLCLLNMRLGRLSLSIDKDSLASKLPVHPVNWVWGLPLTNDFEIWNWYETMCYFIRKNLPTVKVTLG